MNAFKSLGILSLAALFVLLAFSCSSRDKKTFSEARWAQQVENTRIEDLYAPHVRNNRFYTPWMEMGDKSFWDVLGWKLFSKTSYTPAEKAFLPRVIPDTAGRLEQVKGDFIVWIGHNTFLIRIDDVYWMTDPIFSKRALVPARLTPPALTIEKITVIAPDVNIVISHNHYDHLDRASIRKLPENARVFVPRGLGTMVRGMNKKKVQEMDWWEKTAVSDGATLTCLPAQHWSLRINQGRNRSLWASWLLITPLVNIYFGGDSGYFKGFREIGRKFPKIDYAFMATTAYHPRWFMQYQHMNVPEAIQGFDDLGARFFIPTQWGTFHLGSEPAGFPGLDLKRHIRQKHLDPLRFKILDIGQVLPLEASPDGLSTRSIPHTPDH